MSAIVEYSSANPGTNAAVERIISTVDVWRQKSFYGWNYQINFHRKNTF